MNDVELIRYLAIEGMGWKVYPVSHHRRGSRPLPHAWQWRRDGGVFLMVWDGAANREWNPLTSDPDAAELTATLNGRGFTFSSGLPPREQSTAIAEVLAAQPKEPPPDEEL